jgi:hypothetical protein
MRPKYKFLASDFDDLERREVLSHVVHPVVHAAVHHAVHPAPKVHAKAAAHPTAALSATTAAKALSVTAKPVAVAAPISPPPLHAAAVVTSPNTIPNMDHTLNQIYAAFQSGSDSVSLAAQFPQVQFSGNMVGVSFRAKSDANVLATELANLGATGLISSSTYRTVEAFVPINELAAAASLDQTMSGLVLYKPNFNSAPSGPLHGAAVMFSM